MFLTGDYLKVHSNTDGNTEPDLSIPILHLGLMFHNHFSSFSNFDKSSLKGENAAFNIVLVTFFIGSVRWVVFLLFCGV